MGLVADVGRDRDRFLDIQSSLAQLLSGLDDPAHIYADITRPLSGGRMEGVLVQNMPSSYVNVFPPYFRWSERGTVFLGIAGKCASLREPVIIEDLKDQDNPDVHAFVSTIGWRSGSIVSVPVLDPLSRSCLAVVSVTSMKRGFFTHGRASEVLDFAESLNEFCPALIKYAASLGRERPDFPVSDYVDVLPYNTGAMSHEQQIFFDMRSLRPDEAVARLGFEQKANLFTDLLADLGRSDAGKRFILDTLREVGYLQKTDSVNPAEVSKAFEALIEKLFLSSGRDPVRVRRVWEAFQGRENETLVIDDFAPLFRTKKSAYNAVALVGDALKEFGFEITHNARYGELAQYRILPLSSSLPFHT